MNIDQIVNEAVLRIGNMESDELYSVIVREACEVIIEGCAQIVDRQAQGFQVLADHAPTPLRERDMKSLVHSLEVTAKEIRVLSEGNSPDHLRVVAEGEFTPDPENVRRVGYSEPEPEAKPWPAKVAIPTGFRLKDPVTIKSTPEAEAPGINDDPMAGERQTYLERLEEFPEPEAGPHLFYKCAEQGHDPMPEINLRSRHMRMFFCQRCKLIYFE